MSRQRQELAEFVRSRRERRTPEEAGLPGGGRRRTPGLRREEVATLARVSITWYTWLEQGRDMKVSRQVLASLAGALGLDETERRHLFRLAGELPPSPGAKPDQLPAQYHALLSRLEPDPAFIVNRRFDVLAWNPAAAKLFGDFGALEPSDRNILWMTFQDPHYRSLSRNQEQEAEHTLALFRTQLAESLLDEDVSDLIDRLSAASADFRTLWAKRELEPFVPHRRALRHPELGDIEVDYVKLLAAGDDKTVVVYLMPGSPDTSM